ncbi:MAG: M48 family metallopeptidase [Desulfarculus sp.]|nr:M48 family metallopeptidase [Desulfarculus sp.]
MSRVLGHWLDGQSSARVAAALVSRPEGGLRVERLEDGLALLTQDKFQAQVSPRLGSTPRHIRFPQGAQFVSEDNQGVDELLSALGRPRPWMALVQALEAHKGYVALSLAAVLLIIFVAVRYGMPLAAREVASRLSPEVMRQTEEQILAVLDKTVLSPTQLPPQVQARLQNHFRPALLGNPLYNLRVLFRKGGDLGPNALALPAGAVVFTDEMVNLAQHDDELLAVLAHEIGHVVHRHSLRMLVQNSLLALMALAVTGDVSGTSNVFLGAPVVLTELYYSREFERQADLHALRFLCARGIKTSRFADLLIRVSAEVDKKRGGGDQKWGSYFSSHPGTAERVLPFQAGASGCANAFN